MENLHIPYEARRQVGHGRVLVFAPHPDDEVFGCGGAIMRHVATGDPVHVVIVTDGGHDPDASDSEKYILEREQESLRAAEVLGYGRPVFWRMKDRELVYGEPLIRRIEAAILEFRTDFVYAPSIHEIHPDHRVLAMAAMEAVRHLGGGMRLAMYEVGAPLQPNLLLDISDLRERKQTAMRCFVSQLAKQPYDQHIAALNRFRTYTLATDVTAAEAYKLVSAEELGNRSARFYESDLKLPTPIRVDWDLKDAPLVSVIIRSIGREQLQEALDSVALQTYPNIEVVVVNAKGGDHPPLDDRCGRFPLRVVNTGGSLSRSRAANEGLRETRGEYLIFLDDDDWFLPSHVSTLMGELLSHPDSKFAYSGVKCLQQTDSGSWKEVHIFNDPFDSDRLLYENYIPIHAVLFSRTLVDEGCWFDEDFDLYEDWDFWIQTSMRTTGIHVDGFTAAYRISSGGGFGVTATAGQQAINQSLVRLFEKWRHRWSTDQLISLVSIARAAVLQKKECVKLRENLSQMQRDLHTATANLSLSDKELQSLRRSLTEHEKWTIAMLNSTSWRVTAPMRAVGGWFRKYRLTFSGVSWAALRSVYRVVHLLVYYKQRFRTVVIAFFRFRQGRKW